MITHGADERFPKSRRVRKRADFVRIQRKGRKQQTANFVVVSALTPRETRFGFSVSRKVGNAVVRNRLKRRLREICRLNRSRFAAQRDFVVIAKSGADKLSYADIIQELGRALGR